MANTIPLAANTPLGSLSAIPFALGGLGRSAEQFLLASQGTFTLNGTTAVTVPNANLTANSMILMSLKTVGGTVGAQPVPSTVTPGTGFTVVGTASDTSVYSYLILG